jgi:hypothetical protein
MIKDTHHVHLNSTKWNSLTEFIQDFGQMEKYEIMYDDSPIAQPMVMRVPPVKKEEPIQIDPKELERKREEKLLRKQMKQAKKIEVKCAEE